MKKIICGGLTLLCFIIFQATGFPQELSSESSVSEPAPDSASSLEAGVPGTKIVKAIEIQGNKSISLATILSKIKIRVGEEYRQNVISDDLKRLYNTGYFSDVRVDREDYEGGLKVIIYVEEKPVVEKITFSKLRYQRPRTLLNKMKTKKGKFLDKKLLRDDVKTIQELYVKKGLTDVSIDVETTTDEESGKVSLHFVIREGDRIKIQRIEVSGNESYRDKKIIRVIKSRHAWLFGAGYLKEDILKEDMDRIEAFYEQEGFIDASASYTVEELKKPGRRLVRIQIDEGKRYYVGSITVKGNEIVSDDEVLSTMQEIKEGGVFSRGKLSVDLGNIQTMYFDRGYIFARVDESTSLDPQTGKVQITLDIKEGSIAYVRKIKIEGNTRTRDIVIRRELRLHPGDQFDGAKLRRSKERLRNLGYFEEINYDIEDTNVPDQKDLVVQVKEVKTGSFSFGGGFSTVDKVVGFVEIEQKNFDFTNWPTFTGGGQNLTVRAEAGSVRSNRRLSFTEPWIFDYPVSGGFDAYQTTREREEDVGFAYDEERVGGGLRFGKEFTESVSGRLFYTWEKVTIDNIEPGVSAALLAEEGTNVVSDIGVTLTRDTRDSIFSPTQGLVLSGTADVAGSFLGGDRDFYRFQTRTSYYIPLKFNSVLEFRVQTGFVDAYGDSSEVPIFERFFAGGARSIRGYEERNVGPLDPVSEDPIGGESLLVGNIEYTVPIVDFIKVAGFFDSGNVWSKVEDFGSGDFKSGFGLGLRIRTPIGPVNLDYGFPLNEVPGEDQNGKFYFSVSRGF